MQHGPNYTKTTTGNGSGNDGSNNINYVVYLLFRIYIYSQSDLESLVYFVTHIDCCVYRLSKCFFGVCVCVLSRRFSFHSFFDRTASLMHTILDTLFFFDSGLPFYFFFSISYLF